MAFFGREVLGRQVKLCLAGTAFTTNRLSVTKASNPVCSVVLIELYDRTGSWEH